jgi:hypothetical protein
MAQLMEAKERRQTRERRAEWTKARSEQIRRDVELPYEQPDQAQSEDTDHIYRHSMKTQLGKTTAELIGLLSNWAPVVHQQHQQ